MDQFLRRSMAAPIPELPRDFDQRVVREIRHRSQESRRFRKILLGGYGLVSVVVSAVVMRGEGLGWGPVALMVLGPLALVAAVPWAMRTRRKAEAR